MEGNYVVRIEDFARKHFIKSFEKKYNAQWDITLRSIELQLERIDNFIKTDKATTIVNGDDIKIIKTEFRVVNSKESAKSSGNRCIVAWHQKEGFVSILLVYSKTDLSSKNNETAEWKNLIKENYKEYSKIL